MTAWDYIAAATGAWLIVGVVIASAPHRLRRFRRHYRPDRVHWIADLPPVPAPRASDESWLDLVPVDCLVDDDPLLHQRFYALVDAEQWFTP